MRKSNYYILVGIEKSNRASGNIVYLWGDYDKQTVVDESVHRSGHAGIFSQADDASGLNFQLGPSSFHHVPLHRGRSAGRGRFEPSDSRCEGVVWHGDTLTCRHRQDLPDYVLICVKL